MNMSPGKSELHALIDALAGKDPQALAQCIDFVTSDTRGFWHNRARAKMCRRLKHIDLSKAQIDRLVHCIGSRLASGDFSEQFRDQLRLAMRLDPAYMAHLARQSAHSKTPHIARLAGWVLMRLKERSAEGFPAA